MNSPDTPSDKLMQSWQVHPGRDPAFRQRVWDRIQARRREASWPGYLRAHALAATGALAVALLLGAWTGHAQARHEAARLRAVMARSYVDSLDARAMTREP